MLLGALVEDLTVYFDGSSVPAEFEGTSTAVLLDVGEQDILNGMGQSTVYTMTYISADFPDLAHGCAITVDGKNYQVHSISKVEPDGAFSHARLFAV